MCPPCGVAGFKRQPLKMMKPTCIIVEAAEALAQRRRTAREPYDQRMAHRIAGPRRTRFRLTSEPATVGPPTGKPAVPRASATADGCRA